MLQAVHLTKIYKTKGGVPVRALDDVTLTFPEKGMVFLLGKSGSGKSTLLNVCGGLDAPTSGEVIVKGRSSKDFSQSDFDSYRNTFVGFIFQEYNILNEFTVEQNISLALELQGKPKGKKEVSEILKQVDLEGYAKRKPNTLSGGQKQRIAIARALIKNPEIIMADEPTGALDSSTGKQVFDTLKKLSKEKLVVVVSHDREFAEYYADRIIELKDGKILSDVEKVKEKSDALSDNVTIIGKNTINVRCGKSLSEQDANYIFDFLRNSEGDVFISNGERELADFKKAAKISSEGEREVFKESKSIKEPRSYTKEESRFIRSKLPIRHAFKLGTSGLKTKPFRLILTIFLSVVSFVMFGLLSTLMMYNRGNAFATTLQNSSLDMLQIQKYYNMTYQTINGSTGEVEYENTWANQTYLTQQEVADISTRFHSPAIGAIETNCSLYNVGTSRYVWYMPSIGYFGYMAENDARRTDKNFVLAGKYPTVGIEKGKTREVMISSYLADCILECGLINQNNIQESLSDYASLVGKPLKVSSADCVISGVFNSGEVNEKFERYKKMSQDSLSYTDYYAFRNYLTDDIFTLAFFTKDVIEKTKSSSYDENSHFDQVFLGEEYVTLSNKNIGDSETEASYASFEKGKEHFYLHGLNGSISSLSEKQVVVSVDVWATKVLQGLDQIAQNDPEFYAQIDADGIWNDCYAVVWGYQESFDENGEHYVQYLSLQERNVLADEIIKKIESFSIDMSLRMQVLGVGGHVSVGTEYAVDIVGFFLDDARYARSGVLVSDSIIEEMQETSRQYGYGGNGTYYYTIRSTKYKEPADALYNVAFVGYDHSTFATNEVRTLDLLQSDDSFLAVGGSIGNTFSTINEFVEMGKQIFLWTGLVLAVFAMLLLANFISVSISYKKKEIGILRAVGARSLDVFRIFFSESAVIASVCFVLAAIGTAVVCSVLNHELAGTIGVAIFSLGPVSVLALMGIAALTAIVATFLPVYRAARKKPVESIRTL